MNRNGTMHGNGRTMRGGFEPQRDMVQNGRNFQKTNCGYQECTPSADAEADFSDIPAADIPAADQKQLLMYIDEVSFCAYDLMLYLDTHPEDKDAMRYFSGYNNKRKKAMRIYEETYGPLRFSHFKDSCTLTPGNWVNQAWPWEGGEC